VLAGATGTGEAPKRGSCAEGVDSRERGMSFEECPFPVLGMAAPLTIRVVFCEGGRGDVACEVVQEKFKASPDKCAPGRLAAAGVAPCSTPCPRHGEAIRENSALPKLLFPLLEWR
jgi:hypothetical protein